MLYCFVRETAVSRGSFINRVGYAVVALFAVVVLGATAATAADLGANCAAAKQKAAAKKLNDKVKCHGKAIKKNIEVDAACLAKAETKFETSFSKAEGKGGCATVGDVDTIELLIDDTLTQLLNALPPVTTTTTTTTLPPNDCGSLPCGDCQACAAAPGGECSDEVDTFYANAQVADFTSCVESCLDQACFDGCITTYSSAGADYLAAVACIEGECETTCSVAACGNGLCEAGEDAFSCSFDCGPAGWTCAPSYYGTLDGCDCGCGILDPDCLDSTSASCEFCDDAGSCAFGLGPCPSTIDPTDNSQCAP